MMVEPSKCTFETLMEKRYEVASYNGGDQGFLNEMFTWWHRWPSKLNHLKIFTKEHDKERRMPKDLYTIYYLGMKPWMCTWTTIAIGTCRTTTISQATTLTGGVGKFIRPCQGGCNHNVGLLQVWIKGWEGGEGELGKLICLMGIGRSRWKTPEKTTCGHRFTTFQILNLVNSGAHPKVSCRNKTLTTNGTIANLGFGN